MAYADSPTRYHLGYSHVPIHAHIPILPIENLASFNAHGVHTGEYVFDETGDGMGERRAKAGPKKGEVVATAAAEVVIGDRGAEKKEEFWGVAEEGSEESGTEDGVERVRDWGRRDGRVLRDVVIQGNFEVCPMRPWLVGLCTETDHELSFTDCSQKLPADLCRPRSGDCSFVPLSHLLTVIPLTLLPFPRPDPDSPQ